MANVCGTDYTPSSIMSRLSGWFSKPAGPSPEEVAQTKKDLHDALEATGLIMNDDIDGAWEQLQKGDSSFHDMGASVTFFMRSVLGFEKSVMAEASSRLADCESRAWQDLKKAQRSGAREKSIYHAGAEYELVIAQSQLMAAVVGVLHESLVEGMKSFYRLRKAYITLQGIIAAENTALQQRPSNGVTTEKDNGMYTPTELEFEDEIDVFIHSGANMCFGMIQLILSLVPPAFSRILSVVGFSGDRTAGVKMLWKSASHSNMNGAVAGLMLLAYYNGMLGAVDILPNECDYDDDAECVGAPLEKCRALLADMRARYPDSGLWRVQDSQLHSNARDMKTAVEILTSSEQSKMKQVAAVNNFELSVVSMIRQDWIGMRDNFLRCLEINDWSPSLYYYMAGCASLELYRDALTAGDETEAKLQKTKTDQFFKKAPTVIGKKRLMARQLPLETFLQKKIERWEARAKQHDIDLADAIGPSPAIEMAYMWNGGKRMNEEEVDRALKNLHWDRCTAKEEVLNEMKNEPDEIGVWALCTASVTKAVGKWEEARSILEENVMKHDK